MLVGTQCLPGHWSERVGRSAHAGR